MKRRMSISKLAVLVLGIVVEIAIVAGAPIAIEASSLDGTVIQLHQLGVTPQLRVLLENTNASTDKAQRISSRGIPDELPDMAQSKPLEGLQTAATDAAGSSSLPPQSFKALSGSDPNGTGMLNQEQPSKREKTYPIWNDETEKTWGTFVESNEERNVLLLNDITARGKVWRRIHRRKHKAIKSGQAEKAKRKRGTAGLSNDELNELDSADLADATVIRRRVDSRLKVLRADKPSQGSKDWETWNNHVQTEETSLARVLEKLASLQAARPGTSGAKEPVRPRNFIGLMKSELDKFRSQDILEHKLLRGELTSRLKKLRMAPRFHKNPRVWQRQRNADLAWRHGLELRNHYPAADIERHVPSVLEAVDGMSTETAAKQIPILLRDKIRKGKAIAAPAQDAVPMSTQHAGISAISPSLAPSSQATTTASHQKVPERVAPSLAIPTETGDASDMQDASKTSLAAAGYSLPSWLRKATVASDSGPGLPQHVASASRATDAVEKPRAAFPSAPSLETRPSARPEVSDPVRKQNEETRQPPALLDLFH